MLLVYTDSKIRTEPSQSCGPHTYFLRSQRPNDQNAVLKSQPQNHSLSALLCLVRTQLHTLLSPQQRVQPDPQKTDRRVSKVMDESLESRWFLLERSRTEIKIEYAVNWRSL